MPFPAHRHWVILPVVALLLAASMADMRGLPYGAQVVDGGASRLVGGGSVLPDPETAWSLSGDAVRLEHGALLIHSAAPVSVVCGRARVTVVAGAAYVRHDEGSLTVAGITAPVLVEVGGSFVAVPAGMQWSGDAKELMAEDPVTWWALRKVHTIADRFAREQRDLLARLPWGDDAPPLQRDFVFLGDALSILPGAQSRREALHEEVLLGAVREAAEGGSIQDVERAILALGALSPRAQSVLVSLAVHRPRVAQLLLAPFTGDPDTLTLFSLLPATSDAAWSLDDAGIGGARRVARIVAFPFADAEVDALGGLARSRWERDLRAWVETSHRPAEFGAAALRALHDLVMKRDRQGYPERARFLAHALLSLPGAQDQSVADGAALLRALDLVDAVVDTPAPISSAHASSASSSERYDATALVLRARRELELSGALPFLETEVTPVAPEIVRVTRAVFGGTHQDRILGFTLDLRRMEAGEIDEGSTTYPLPMPWSDFTRWARR